MNKPKEEYESIIRKHRGDLETTAGSYRLFRSSNHSPLLNTRPEIMSAIMHGYDTMIEAFEGALEASVEGRPIFNSAAAIRVIKSFEDLGLNRLQIRNFVGIVIGEAIAAFNKADGHEMGVNKGLVDSVLNRGQ